MATARGDQLQVGFSKHRTRETGPVSSEGKRHSGNGIWSHIGMNALLGPRSGPIQCLVISIPHKHTFQSWINCVLF